ncbi:MAG: exo-alpha-sialidase [Myxococcales bacterium]|nr:exo-alpha-sialidase [Myxococcales bacterium]
MYTVQSHGVFYSDERFMAAFPALSRTDTGDILLLFRRAPDSRWLLGSNYDEEALSEPAEGAPLDLQKHLYHWDPRSQLVAMRFDQSLQPVAPPIGLSVDGQAADQDASLLRLESGEILLSSFSWYPMPPAFSRLTKAWDGKAYGGPANTGCSFIAWGSYTRISGDGGSTWSERDYLPELPGARPLVPGLRTSHGGCVRGQAVLRNGEILMPSYSEVEGGYSAHLFASKDSGRSWQYRSMMARSEDLSLYEPSLTVCDDGTLIAWIRTDDKDDRIGSARSSDGGFTWEEFQLHKAVGHPAHGLRLRDSRILLTYGYRHEPFGVRARLLNSHGDDIDEAAEVHIRDDGEGTDLGYPWSVELDDGRVLVAYYFTSESGLRNISYSILSLDPSPLR